VELLKHIRTSLSESASEYFKQTIKEVIDVAIVGTRNGEKEGWVTAHGSSVRVITPYDNIITIMHEGGASGGGKGEMIEKIHREMDGKILLSTHTETKEKTYLALKEPCELRPVIDDMALCHPDLQNSSGKLVVKDAEDGWFLLVFRYGKDG
jgi:hypothetical protein